MFSRKISLVSDREFYKRVVMIMVPVAVQQAINMGVNMMDTVMLGSFGEAQLSASSLANSFYSLYNIFCMGIIGGCSVLVAQFWGAGNKEKVKEVFSLAVRLACGLGLLFAAVTWLFPEQIMRMFSQEPEVIEYGIRYLKITTFVYVVHGTSLVVSFLMRSIRQAQLGLYVSIISFGVNVFANWVFIFGKLGCPRMEIAGAALGTLIARLAEFIVTFSYVLFIDKKLKIRILDFIHNPSGMIMRKYAQVGAPAMMSDGLLGLGQMVVSMVLGRMGADVVAANSICQVINRLFTVMVQGIANAASIVTGNTIGENKLKEAYDQGITFYILSVACGVFNCILILLVGRLTIQLYRLQPSTVAITNQMMTAYAFIMIFSSIQSVMTKGVLRGGGDTKFLLKADILFLWVVSIPLGFLVGVVLHGAAWLTVICLQIDYVIKSLWCVSRLKSGKWIRNVNVE